ncbi:MAG TPA: hypothetical protein VIL37_14170 [Natronosporangium sp.]
MLSIVEEITGQPEHDRVHERLAVQHPELLAGAVDAAFARLGSPPRRP